MTPDTLTAASTQAGRREWIGLAVLVLPNFLLSLDVSVLYLALPHIAADLGADGTQQLWILDIYSFILAGFLVTMGTLGDRIGRRRLLLVGAACFGTASVVAAFSNSAAMLIASRALLGVAGATLMPSTMALIRNMFPDPKQMASAIGVWFATFLGGLTLGPLVGGALLERFWWGSAFLLGVPFMVVLLIAGPALLPEYRDRDAGRLDLFSVGLSLASILPIIYGLKGIARNGVEAVPLAAIVTGAVVGVVFVRRQLHLASPLLDLNLFRIRAFSASLGTILLVGVVMAGVSLVESLYLQMVAGLPPLQAGLWLVPQSIAMAASILMASRLATRFGRESVMAVGMAVATGGLLLLTQVRSADGTMLLVAGVVLISAGMAAPLTLMAGIVLGSAPPEKAGSAASLNETCGELGVALGVATVGTLASFVYRTGLEDRLPPSVPNEALAMAREGIAGAVAAAQTLPAGAAAALLEVARDSFTAAVNTTGAVCSVVFFGLVILVITTFKQRAPAASDDAASQPTEAWRPTSAAGPRTLDQPYMHQPEQRTATSLSSANDGAAMSIRPGLVRRRSRRLLLSRPTGLR